MSDLWQGRQWRMVYGPQDLDTGTKRCLHAQRNPRLRYLPLPRAGLLVRAHHQGRDRLLPRDGAQPAQRERDHQPDPYEFEKS